MVAVCAPMSISRFSSASATIPWTAFTKRVRVVSAKPRRARIFDQDWPSARLTVNPMGPCSPASTSSAKRCTAPTSEWLAFPADPARPSFAKVVILPVRGELRIAAPAVTCKQQNTAFR